MIKKFVGKGWYLDADCKKVECEFKAEDGMLQGVCDLCGEQVCDEEGEGQSVFETTSEVNECAEGYDWLVIGDNHHICRWCRGKIDNGELDIEIKKKESK